VDEKTKYICYSVAIILLVLGGIFWPQPDESKEILSMLPARLDSAYAHSQDDKLIVTTGIIEQQWKWTGYGFVTVSLKQKGSDKNWADKIPAYNCDWQIPGLIENKTKGKLISLTTNPGRVEGEKQQYMEVAVIVFYRSAKLKVKYTIWAYPNSPKLRTQIAVMGTKKFKSIKPKSENSKTTFARTAYLPTNIDELQQGASFFVLEDANDAEFVVTNNGLEIMALGLDLADINKDKFKKAGAVWTQAYRPEIVEE
jgi:hypothetical protein